MFFKENFFDFLLKNIVFGGDFRERTKNNVAETILSKDIKENSDPPESYYDLLSWITYPLCVSKF